LPNEGNFVRVVVVRVIALQIMDAKIWRRKGEKGK
jgi:hypothetical protein